MSFHSDSAKEASRKQIDGWIKAVEDNIKSLKAEKVKIQEVLKRMDKASKIRMKPALDNIDSTISIREEQLKNYKAVKEQYKKDGLI